MENFYDDEFERYLKEQADQFKLEPSKKAWHGIYNNFHPGRRWPSVATGLMIILLLTVTNNLNTRQQKEVADNAVTEQNEANTKSKNKIHSIRQKSRLDEDPAFENGIIADLMSMEEMNNQPAVVQPLVLATGFSSNISSSNINDQDNKIVNDKNLTSSKQNNIVLIDKHLISVNSIPKNTTTSIISKNETIIDLPVEYHTVSNIPVEIQKLSISSVKLNTALINTNASADFKKMMKKLRHKGTWNFYVSPTLNYRTMSSAAVSFAPTNTNSTAVSQPDMSVNINNYTLQHVAPGLELGSSVSFNIARNLQFFTGLQLNYSGFNIIASHTHPVVASIQVINNGVAAQVPAISFYSNEVNQSSITLHNYQVEGMIPIGLNYKIYPSNIISINFLSAFQPSIILKEQSYLLSTDTRNYVSYPDLQRNLNINGEWGVFVGFKMGKFNYSIGPEFRYQLLSNLKKSSPYKEHLTNYGIRFGISR